MRVREFSIISGTKMPSHDFYNTQSYKFPVINNDKPQKSNSNSQFRRVRSLNQLARRGRQSKVFPKTEKMTYLENLKKKPFYLARKNIQEQKTFDVMFQSKQTWDDRSGKDAKIPRSLINCSSEKWDILGNCNKRYPGTSIRELKKRPIIENKKKAIAELSDLGRLQHPNFHPDYKKYMKNNKFVFRKPKGYCANLNDKGYRNGKVHKLFYKYRDD